MSYCHECGLKVAIDDTYCNSCGVKVISSNSSSEGKESNKRRGKTGFVILIFIILSFGYLALDIWAATQLKPDMSAEGLMVAVSNLKVETGATSLSTSTNIRIRNPTFVPVIAGRIVYDAGYGSTKVAEGKTGLVILGPYSTKDLPAEVSVSYVQAGVAGFNALKNLITGNKEKPNANVYLDLGLSKIQIARYDK